MSSVRRPALPPFPHPVTVLLVGGGAREHAMAEALAASPRLGRLLAAPGNPGIAAHAVCHAVAADDLGGLVDLAVAEQVDFVLPGPEAPLCAGLVDALATRGIAAFGPGADLARLEGSKSFAKRFLARRRIPTASFEVHTDPELAATAVRMVGAPVVIKADGLAGGKGVTVASTVEQALAAVEDALVRGALGEAGRSIVIEQCLTGPEASIHVLVSGSDYAILPTSQDHKRVGDGDTGPNTGGMGAYSPARWIDSALEARIEREIVRPTVDGLVAEGGDYRGVLFIGIMVTPEGPKVLEYNVRFGDPETEVILPRLAGDPLELLLAVVEGRLGGLPVPIRPEPALAVVLAQEGYPGAFRPGAPLTLPEALPPGTALYHAGTARGPDGRLRAHGGRVLVARGLGRDLREAADRAYAVAEAVVFDSKHLRRDIGWQELGRPAPSA